MRFEWDDAKDAANIEKHGIGFSQVVVIFDGIIVSRIDDRKNMAKSAL